MKDPSLEQQLLLATIDDRDEAPDACEDDKRSAVQRSRLRNPIIAETIPEESGNASSPENDDAERPAAVATCPASDPATRKAHHNKLPGTRRRHRKFSPIHQLSLYRQVTSLNFHVTSFFSHNVLLSLFRTRKAFY